MLLEIDHIAFSSNNFERDSKILRSLGYKQVFSYNNIKNLEIKNKLLKNKCTSHDLSLFTLSGSLGIELINHGQSNVCNPCIIPIFENISNEFVDTTKIELDRFGIKTYLKSIDIPIYISDNTDVPVFCFKSITIKTRNVKNSTDFWYLLGFKIISINKELAILEFSSSFRNNRYRLYLIRYDDFKEIQYLDDKGFNCIAFISNSSDNDRSHLLENKVVTTNIENLTLGQKSLDIFFAKGPSGEIVEIISVNSKYS